MPLILGVPLKLGVCLNPSIVLLHLQCIDQILAAVNSIDYILHYSILYLHQRLGLKNDGIYKVFTNVLTYSMKPQFRYLVEPSKLSSS